MTDDKLQELLQEASRVWRVPPPARVEEIWAGIEERHFDRRRQRLTPRWLVLLPAVAASLVAGVAIGRFSAVDGAVTLPPIAVSQARVGEPYGRTTTELLGRTAVLLASLPEEAREGRADARFGAQAAQLLVTTRLLLDSPVAADQRLRYLLEDLELVLAQVSQLSTSAPRSEAELEIITTALEERDVVPRIRNAVASLGGADN